MKGDESRGERGEREGGDDKGSEWRKSGKVYLSTETRGEGGRKKGRNGME